MLRRIGLTNFKCFDVLDLQCAPLNLLCGLNGMGKSSVIQALLVLRQSFESGELTAGHLVLGGALIDLGAGSDVLFEDAEEEVVEFMLTGEHDSAPWKAAFEYSSTGDELTVLGAADTTSTGVAVSDGPIGGPSASAGHEIVSPMWRAGATVPGFRR
ncbi:MAG: AAA family ATPase [Gammaproteobacteria bacterium]|nr:AAA family ATPase [Gammaproteobacteria bacterium]